MKIIKSSLVLVLLACLYGCKGKSVFVGEARYGLTFAREHTFPPGEPIFEAFGGQSIQIVDTFLLVQHQYPHPEFYWDIYNLNNRQHLKSILRRGRGPNEVLFAHYDGQHEKVNGENWMFFLDVNANQFFKINLEQTIRSGKDSVVSISSIDSSKSPYFTINDNLFLYFPFSRSAGYMKVIKSEPYGKNPVMTKEIFGKITPEEYAYYLHDNSMNYNGKKNKVCVTYGRLNHIQLIDLEGNDDLILSAASSSNWPALQQSDPMDLLNRSIFYVSPRSTDDYIFISYYNKKISEMQNSPKECEVHVFDWEGNALAKLSFQDHIGAFAVDEKNKILYGINNREQIYAYDISPYL
jgi:hypothetical protein